MKKYICDRCGADITDSGAFGEVLVRIYQSPEFDAPFEWMAGENDGTHYCRKCAEEITEFVKNPPTAAEPEPKKGKTMKEESKKPERRKIDYGKIMALKNAGWDNGKIAEEMHMTKAAVATAISKCRKEGMLNEAQE